MKYFEESEFNNFEMMDEKLLSMLDEVREIYGYPIKITSDYRSPEHPIEAASVGGEKTFKLVKAAIEVGFTRIGISRKKGFIHLGIGYSGAPDTTIWTY